MQMAMHVAAHASFVIGDETSEQNTEQSNLGHICLGKSSCRKIVQFCDMVQQYKQSWIQVMALYEPAGFQLNKPWLSHEMELSTNLLHYIHELILT